ncbi:MAG: hypothetical protein QOG48_1728 [Verrucomicrobiota bacterium]|jgi:hypothetical protein
MTARILLLITCVCAVARVHALDLNKLPPMNETKVGHDLELKGRELEAMEVALHQFREDHFSTSGDLKHFEIWLTRESGKLFVSFLPDTDERSHRITPAHNKYGTFITYAVSLRTLKIIGYHFERD